MTNFQLTLLRRLTSVQSKLWRLCLTVVGLSSLLGLGNIPGIQGTHAAAVNDPIFAQQVKLVLSDGTANEGFGNRVALSGNWAVFGQPNRNIGAKEQQGAAYVYQRSGTTWTLKQILTASDGSAGAYFGTDLAISGATMVIGAYGYNGDNNRFDMGAAYVFALVGNTWVERQKLTASDGQANDNFGISVALSGQTILVGAPGAFFTDTHTPGAAYVFIPSGTNWVQQQKLTALDGVPGGYFGGAVTISGNTLAASTSDNPWLGIEHGAVYLFTQSGGGWNFQQKLTSPNPVKYGHYGHKPTLNGDTLVVGGEIATVGYPETVYVYVPSNGIWGLQQKLSTPDGSGAAFGSGLSFDGNRIVVGCTNDEILGAPQRGSAYVFARTGTTWNLQQKLIAPDGQADDYFGSGVALSGDTIIVGARFDDIGANQNQGSAYVFTLQAGNSLPTITPSDPYTIQRGSTVGGLLVATINDQETPAASLLFDHDTTFGFTLSNVVNNGGYVSATINGSCSGALGENKVELNVIDGSSAVGVTALTVIKTANTAPTLGNYPSVTVMPGNSVSSTPDAVPTDNGTRSLTTTVAPAGFTGTITVNQFSGVVTISNAGPAGNSYTVTVKATDNCGAITTRTFSLTILKFSSPPTLTSSLNPSVYAQPVTFTATIAPPHGAHTPTGTVQFQDNGVNLGSPARLVNGSASLTTSALSPGNHQITAVYSGDAYYNSTSSTLTQVVNR
jgi:hypothetical protein